jgi:hypothetical protein
MMKHYLFIDDETGEEFIVGAYSLEQATQIAIENFEAPAYLGYEMTEEEAECSGLDEY